MAVIGCNSRNDTGQPAVIQRDTSQVLALYKSAIKAEVLSGIIGRVVVDTFTYIDTDSVTKIKRWVKDTTYLIAYPTKVDSAISRQYKVPIYDSTGKQNVLNLIATTHKKFVRSGWERIDSVVVKELLSQQ